MTKQTKDGVTLSEIFVWFLAGLMGAAVLGGLAIVWIIFFFLTWPYYLLRGVARWD
jgi:hypothetical protein